MVAPAPSMRGGGFTVDLASQTSAGTSSPLRLTFPWPLQAVSSAGPRVDLTWMPRDTATGYVVERSDGGGVSWNTLARLGSGVSSFSDTAVAPSTSYRYRVTFDGCQSSEGVDIRALA